MHTAYDGVTMIDTVTGAAATQNYTIGIPAIVGANTTFVGFTGGTGDNKTTRNVLSWTFAPQS